MITEQFVEKAKKIHGDKYDYTKVNYKNAHSKVIIICPIHGEFEQRAADHCQGKGCRKCANNYSDADWFIQKAKKIHGDKYNYSKIKYDSAHRKVIIICPIHGEFEQTPSNHLNGFGCVGCAHNDLSDKFKMCVVEFINKSNQIHGNKYNYSKVNYVNSKTKVIIICPEHGEFEQVPYSHLNGSGCYKCGVSSEQQEIVNYIKSIYDNQMEINNRQVIAPLELDIYLPEISLAFEYHGMYWHSYPMEQKILKKEKNKHQDKYLKCKEKGIMLVQILENEWANNQEETKRRIKCYIESKDFDNRQEIDLRYPLLEMDGYKISKPQYCLIKHKGKLRKFWDAGKATNE